MFNKQSFNLSSISTKYLPFVTQKLIKSNLHVNTSTCHQYTCHQKINKTTTCDCTASSADLMKGWSYVDVYDSLMFGIVTATTSSATIQELMKSWSNVDVDVSLMFARRVELMTCWSLVRLG